jgi:hypothetical protein
MTLRVGPDTSNERNVFIFNGQAVYFVLFDLFTAGPLKTKADVSSQRQYPLTQRHSFVSRKTPAPPDNSIASSTTNLTVESEDNFRTSMRPQGIEKK